ncbi:MAG TPA: hypothetical protein VLE72_01755 [Candidatus Saccharimonadales bacterium]|nr:hypothetical protein [Candidatus Saccharimonadales bacterium]
MSRLPSVWQLTKQSLSLERSHLKIFLGITALVAVPTNLINLAAGTSDASISTYLSLASLLMNIALIWTVIQLEAGRQVTLRQAYYGGTANLVKFLLVSVALILELLPLALALVLYSVGVIGASPGTSLAERIIISALAITLAIPSIFWLNRGLFALYEVTSGSTRPIQALRTASQRVRGHSWAVLSRLLGLVIATLILALIPAAPLVLIYAQTTNHAVLALLQVLISLLVLPFAVIYINKLYRALAS